jgi:hypothetical protein
VPDEVVVRRDGERFFVDAIGRTLALPRFNP